MKHGHEEDTLKIGLASTNDLTTIHPGGGQLSHEPLYNSLIILIDSEFALKEVPLTRKRCPL